MDTLVREIYDDLVYNCDQLLAILYKNGNKASNDTPLGRVIYHLRWIKQEIGENKFAIPDNGVYHSIMRIYAEGDLNEKFTEIYTVRVISLLKGSLLLKPAYYPPAFAEIDTCIDMTKDESYHMKLYETKYNTVLASVLTRLELSMEQARMYHRQMIGELEEIKTQLNDNAVELPLKYGDYFHWWKIGLINSYMKNAIEREYSISNQKSRTHPDFEYHRQLDLVSRLIFLGIRAEEVVRWTP